MRLLLLVLASLPLMGQTVASLTCDKTAFVNHGDTSICTVTLTSPAPANGLNVSPYTADAPLVTNPPATSGSVSVNVGGQKWSFSLPASLPVGAGALTWKFTVTFP